MKSLLFQIVFKFSSIHDRNFIKLIPVMYRIKLLCLLSFLPIIICGSNYSIIPFPQKLIEKKGNFTLNRHTGIVYSRFTIQEITSVSSAFIQKFQTVSDIQLRINPSSVAQDNTIFIKKNTNLKNTEAYKLLITKSNITIEASTPQGAFYALQTLRQLLTNKFESLSKQSIVNWEIPCCEIEDAPDLKYRGLMLDVCRSFSGVEEVKALIDQLAFLKLNTFHWHLTDDQGWRIEIKKYPKLTSVGGFRNKTLIGHYNTIPQMYDQTKVGGFYTQQEIRDVVKYAADRFVEVIPEIEMPGHSMAALAAYPQFSCSGGPFDVAEKWGVFNDIYCSKEETFRFLEDILSEVIPLFDSKYIHLGGDEAPHVRWHNCVNCQRRMKELDLKDEMELQSYFVNRMEKFVNSKGKKMIGWEEILNKGLTKEATIMSWRGDNGSLEAARLGYNVIMTPGTHMYFDAYQSQSITEPLAIGGYNPIENVYSYNPQSDSLNSEQKKCIIGVQANLFTEYLPKRTNREYMLFPRIAALSEIAWLPANKKDYSRFCKILPDLLDKYKVQGINFSNAFYNIEGTTILIPEGLGLTLTSIAKGNIHYTLDGTTPDIKSPIFNSPILLGKEMTIKAVLFNGTENTENYYEQKFVENLLAGEKIEVTAAPSPKYKGHGATTLTDCIVGRYPLLGSQWLGYEGTDTEILVSFKKPKDISELTLSSTNQVGQWIYAPSRVELYIQKPNDEFVLCGKFTYNEIIQNNSKATLKFPKARAIAVKAIVKNYGIIPQGNEGEGQKSWLFIGEFIAK